MPVEYYRSTDPLENLRLRVIVREISRPKKYSHGDNSSSGNSNGRRSRDDDEAFFSADQLLSWQQKLYSPPEIADYIANKAHNRGSAVQIETRSQLTRLEKQGQDVKGMLRKCMLYTYIDKDHFEVEETIVRGMERTVPDKIRRNRPYKSMHICLATDVELDGIVKESYGRYNKFFAEHVLCTLKIYQDGLVEVSPALSKILRETPSGIPLDVSSQYGNTLNPHDSSSVQALSLFMNDNTVQAGLRKGFLLSHLRLRSIQSGSEFEYIVFNENDILLPHRLEEIMKKDRMLELIKASESRGQQYVWKQDPPKGDRTVNTYIEIVSGSDFPASSLFVTYSIHLPSSWNPRTGNVTDGDSNLLLGNFGYDEHSRLGGLQGSTHIASSYSNFYSRPYLRQRPFFSGILPKTPFPFSTRLMVAVVFNLFAVTSVVIGLAYPFWVILALVIYFIGAQGINARTLTTVMSRQQNINLNRKKQKEIEVQHLTEKNTVCFNHLMNLSFDVKDTTEKALFSPTNENPILFFQVYSCGMFHRSILEGYGYCVLPNKAGSFDMEVNTWKPIGNIRSRMHEFFVGDHVKLKEEDFCNSIDMASKTMNKFGVLTHTSGSIRIKGQVIVLDPKLAEKYKEEEEAKSMSSSALESGRKTTRSVADILNSYRGPHSSRTKPAVTSLSSRPSSSSTADRPSVKSILEGINATAKANRSSDSNRTNDVLARIKGKKKVPDNEDHVPTNAAVEESTSESTPLLAAASEDSQSKASRDQSSLNSTLNVESTMGLRGRKDLLENAKMISRRYEEKELEDVDLNNNELKPAQVSVTPPKQVIDKKQDSKIELDLDETSPLLDSK